MRVGRNDPCPCGSGKKYKKCCLDLDRQAGVAGLAAGRVRAIAAAAAEWEADIVALPGGLEDDPAARLAVVLVVAEGFVIHSQVLNRSSPEPEAMAETLAAAILDTGERVGGLPELVVVRDSEVAEGLPRHLAERAARTGTGPARLPQVEDDLLSDVDEAAFTLAEHTTGRPGRFHLSWPDTWAGWDLPEGMVDRLFRLAADFYRDSPWTTLTNLDVLEATVPEGGSWTICVLGNGGEEFGISLYSDAEDFWGMTDAESPETAFDDLEGRIVSLHFEAGGDIPRAMRREIAAAGWEVAGAEAYPRIMAFNTPAGGLRRRDVEDLAALLAAVPRFVETQRAAVDDGMAVEQWQDEATGVVFSYRPDEQGEWDMALMPLVHDLAPGCSEGPGADPQALIEGARAAMDDPDALAERQTWVVEQFAVHLREHEGLSGNTATKHAENAATFVGFLAGFGVPMGAVHEYHLREFLFDWYPRKGSDSASRRSAMPGSLARFFDFLAEEEGIVCPGRRRSWPIGGASGSAGRALRAGSSGIRKSSIGRRSTTTISTPACCSPMASSERTTTGAPPWGPPRPGSTTSCTVAGCFGAMISYGAGWCARASSWTGWSPASGSGRPSPNPCSAVAALSRPSATSAGTGRSVAASPTLHQVDVPAQLPRRSKPCGSGRRSPWRSAPSPSTTLRRAVSGARRA